VEKIFGQKPEVFRNTELIYSDRIGDDVAGMGYKAILTEGAKHILGWKSPNFLYCNAINPKLKVLLRNFRLSDDITFRFSNHAWNEYPLTADKYASWINKLPENEEVINIFIDYETFGEHQWAETGIFDFLKALPGTILKKTGFVFGTPSDVADNHQPVSAIHVPDAISWADEERDLTAWKGNELQDDAFRKIYELLPKISKCNNKDIVQDWKLLQTSDHFYYMCTKWFSDGAVHKYFNPYNSPYDAFINFMNVLTDFTERLNSIYAGELEAETSIGELEKKIRFFQAELKKMKAKQKKTV
jgi:alpha-amylase